MYLCIADIDIFVYSIIFAMFVSVLFLGSGVCVETKNIDVFCGEPPTRVQNSPR